MEKTDIPGVYLAGEVPEPGERSTLRGHPIVWDGEEWRYVDTGEPTVGNRRHCGHCGFKDTPDGHDWCLHTLPGVRNACCGHGDRDQAYIQFETGMIVRGFRIEPAHDQPR